MAAGAEAALNVVVRLKDEMTQAMQGIRGGLSNFANEAGKVGLVLSAGVSLPLIAIGKQAVETAATFESQMNILTVAARSSGTGMQQLSQAALLVGKDTTLVGINAQQAAEAMTNFYKAGLTTSDIFTDLNGYLTTGTGLTGALRSAIDLATASELDLNQASRLVATSMATFGLSAQDAGRIANSFVGAADASVASVADLAAGMENIGPTAAQFGWSIESTNTALALLSTRGIMGAEAGTALKSMMLNLLAPTKDNVAALTAMNVSLYDQQGNLLPLPGIIGQLNTAMAGMTQEQRLNTIQTLAGSYGQKAMNTLLAEGVPGWNSMATAIGAAATAQEVSAARTAGLNAALEQLRGAIETVFIQTMLPILQNTLTPFVKGITDLISGLGTLDPQLQNAALAFLAVLAAAGPLLLAVKGIGLVIGALASPIGLIVLALAGLAAAWSSDFLGMRTTITAWWAAVQPQLAAAAQGILTGIGNALTTLRGWWDAHWPAMEKTISAFAAGVASAAKTIADWLGSGGIQRALADLGAKWAEIVGKLQSIWSGLVAFFGPTVERIVEGFQNLIRAMGPLSEQFAKTRAAAEPVLQRIADLFNNVVLPVVVAVIGVIVKLLGETLAAALNNAGKVAEGALKIIEGAFKATEAVISGVINVVKAILEGRWGDALKAGVKAADEFGKGLKTAFEGAVEVVDGAMGTIWDTIANTSNDLLHTSLPKWQEFKDGLAKLWQMIQDSLILAFNNARTAIQGVTDYIAGTAQSVFNTIRDTLQAIYDKLVAIVSSALAPFKTALSEAQPFIDGFARAVSAVASGIDAIKGAIDGVLGKIAALANALASVKLPGQLIGQSPSPFEVSLRGISDAMGELSGTAVPMLSGSLVGLGNTATPSLDGVISLLKSLIGELAELAGWAASPESGFWSAKAVTDPLKIIMENLGSILSNLEKLADEELLPKLRALRGSVREIIALMSEITKEMLPQLADLAGWAASPGSGFWSAKAVTDPLKAIFENLGAIVEGLNALAEADIVAWRTISAKVPVLEDAVREVVAALGRVAEVISIQVAYAAAALATAAGPVLDLIAGAVDAVIALAEMPDLSERISSGDQRKAAQELAIFVGDLVVALGAVGQTIKVELQEAARTLAENAGPVLDIVAGALESITLVSKYIPLPNIGLLDRALQQIAAFVGLLVVKMGFIGAMISDNLETAASAFAEAAGPVLDIVAGAIEALTLVSDYIPVPDINALRAALDQIVAFVMLLVTDLGFHAWLISDRLKAAAATLAEAAGPALDIVSGAIEAITLVSEYIPVPDVGALRTALDQIVAFVMLLVADLGFHGSFFSDILETAAAAFAEAAGAALNIVAGAIEAILLVSEYIPMPDINALDGALQQIADFVLLLVEKLADVAGQISGELQTAAKTFAENAGAGLGVVKAAIETITAVSEYIPIPDITVLDGALQQISAFVLLLVGKLATVAGQISEELQTAAKTFAENAGAGLGVVKAAIETITAVSEYIPIPDITVLDGALQQVAAFVLLLVAKLATVAGQISGELQTAAKTFADNAGAVVGLVKTAIEAINALNDYLGIDTLTIDQFVTDIAYIVKKVGEAAAQFTAEALANASAFATSAQQVANMVKDGNLALVGPDGVQYYHDVSNDAIDMFVADMTYVLDKILLVAAQYDPGGLTAATKTAQAMAAVGKALADGVSGLIKPQGTKASMVSLEDYAGIAHTTIDLFVADMAYIVGKVLAVADDFTLRGLTQAERFAEAGAAIFDALTAGMKAVVGVTTPEGRSAITQFQGDMANVVSIVSQAAADMVSLVNSLGPSAFNAGLSFAQQLAAGIEAGLGAIEAALAAVAALFPHSPAKAGPLKKPPNWNAYLNLGLADAAANVRRQLLTPALTPVSVPALGGGGGRAALGGGGVVNFYYAPTVSMASQREAQETLAPMIAEVLRREARRR